MSASSSCRTGASAMAPDRRSDHAASNSRRVGRKRWKSSVRTAVEVTSGSGSSRTASRHTACQLSCWSSRATRAPVSTRQFAAMPLRYALLHQLADARRTGRVTAGDASGAPVPGGVEPRLYGGLLRVGAVLAQPGAGDLLQEPRHADVLSPRLRFEIGLQRSWQPPTVHF